MMARTQNRKRTGQKARIHSGAVGGKQPVWDMPERERDRRSYTPVLYTFLVTGLWAIEAEWMGRYIDDILQPGEKVLYSTNAHWIFYLPAIAAWLVAIAFLVLSHLMVAGTTPSLLCL